MNNAAIGTLGKKEIEQFINDGFIKIEHAFSEELAAACTAVLWKATGCEEHDPSTWMQPVIRIAELSEEPFKLAANTPVLHNAFDVLAGKNNRWPKVTMGSFPIRFPSDKPAGDTGWHVDASFAGDDAGDYLTWRINIHSKGRALLMLFLFSDVDEHDAPTVIKKSSHIDVAKILSPYGDAGLSFMELAGKLNNITTREEITATGKAGTVYLCHPFIAHKAQEHKGTKPKFMAQPSLVTKHDFNIYKNDALLCAVEKAIVKAL